MATSIHDKTAPRRFAKKQRPLALASDRLLSKAEVAAALGVAISTLEVWVARGEFPQPIQLTSRIIRWAPSSVNSWLARREGYKATAE